MASSCAEGRRLAGGAVAAAVSALRLLDGKDFEVFVSAIICRNEDELQKQQLAQTQKATPERAPLVEEVLVLPEPRTTVDQTKVDHETCEHTLK